jgi:hypothetical protein
MAAADIAAHGAGQHTGSVFPSTPADQVLGDAALEFGDIATPATPAAGKATLYLSVSTGNLSIKKDSGTVVDLEAGGSGTVTSVNVAIGGMTSSGAVTGSGTITMSGTLAVANGGTGSANASDARTALGLAIGTNVQAYDAELAALAGLTSAADKLPYFTGAGTAGVADFTAAGRSVVAGATATAIFDGLSPMSALGDSIYGGAAGTRTRLAGNTTTTRKLLRQTGDGVNSAAPDWDTLQAGDIPDLSGTYATSGHNHSGTYQPLDTDLTAIAALTSAADKGLQSTGAGTWALFDLTAAGKELLNDASAADQRTTLGAAASGAATGSGITMATARLLGRTTASTGAIEEISAGASLSLSAGALGLATAQRTRQFLVAIIDPVAGDDISMGRIPFACTVTRVGSVTDTGTVTFNVEERTVIGTTGTDILSADQVADATGEEVTSSFGNSALAAGNWLFLDITSVATSPTKLTVWVEVTVD